MPGAEGLVGGEQSVLIEKAKLASPEAVETREESRTKFENLNTEQAGRADGEAFPGLVDQPLGGPPSLPAGQQIVGYPSDNVAQVDLGGGKRGVIEATAPIAIEGSSGQRTPIDLGLSEVGSGFEPKTPAVGVSIPKRLSAGVQLPALDLSLTPVDASGTPLGGSEGAVDGASVLYANTQTDTDTLVKPTTGGFETDTVLRSVASPEQLYFRVGLPEGASLVQSRAGSGPVEVVAEGAAVAVIRPPSATDAAGTPVPVSMSVSGGVLALSVASHSGEYEWPISVDPEVEDRGIGPSECVKKGEAKRASSNWCFNAEPPSKFTHVWNEYGVTMENSGSLMEGNYAALSYLTKGISKIYKVEVETYNSVDNGRAKLEFDHEGSEELAPDKLREGFDEGSAGPNPATFCPVSGCPTSGGDPGNLVGYKVEAVGPGSYVYGVLSKAYVYIYQEQGPEVSFNKTEEHPKGDPSRVNVLYGTGAWLGPFSNGAFEIKAHDPGIGISWARIYEPGASYYHEIPMYADGDCNGVQCEENYPGEVEAGEDPGVVTYVPGMADGEKAFEWDAEDEARSYAYTSTIVKVDATPPHNLEVTGWPKDREISATPHTLTVEATDGTKPTVSSGVKSIGISIDGGKESAISGTSCSPGECTASGKYTLDAEDLTEGVHRLVLTATDNAENVASKEFTFDVRHGSPISVGPGSVDPTTGQFKLGATDVSLAGSGAVSRVYESRDLTAGAGGPLGPQWAVSLGGGEGLTVLPTGNVVLAGSSGGVTTFTRNGKGEFESPLGDGNLKIEAKEKETGKGITEYLLIDSSAGTTTRFAQPPGTELTAPTYADSFGAEGAQLHEPLSEAVDASGNVWVTDNHDDRVEKFSPAGALLGTYGSEGTGSGQFKSPWGVAVNQSNGDWYVSDRGNSRIEEFSPSGEVIRSFGSQGSGEGQVNVEAGVAVDSSGNVWIADYGNNRIDEFNSEGKYIKSFGSEGSGNGQFKGPLNIAFSGGNMYVTDYGNNRVQEFSTSGSYIAQFGGGGSGNGQFSDPYGIATEPTTGNLYVADYGNARVQEFSAAGKFIAKFGSSGGEGDHFTGPTGVAVSQPGGVYVADYATNRVEQWARSAWLPTLSEGALKSGTTTYSYEAVEEEGQTMVEPTESVAPTPAGVSCGTKLEELKELKSKGCRALTFKYAKETTASGESESKWGKYKGHLEQVDFTAYNPAAGSEKMEEKPVAEYSYDSKGRLRAEWDPRIEKSTACGGSCSALKTTYGYDAEGHVTSLTPPGQQPWAFTYGTIAGDAGTGRLVKATRAQPKAGASEEEVKSRLKEQQEQAENTSVPKLSGPAVVGVTMGVSNGSWSKSPVAYGYQWNDCNLEGKECTPILGATNGNYKVAPGDMGHELMVQVTATNGGGSVVASTSAARIWEGAVVYSSSFGSKGSGHGEIEHPGDVAVGPGGNLWVLEDNTEVGRARVEEFNQKGEYLREFGSLGSGNGQMRYPTSLAVNSKGDVWVLDDGNDRVEEFSETGELLQKFGSEGSGNGQFQGPEGIAVDSHGDVWVADSHNGRLQEFNEKGEFMKVVGSKGTGPGQFGEPEDIAIDAHGNLWVADWGDNRVEEFSETGSYVREFGSEGTGNGQFEQPYGIAVNSSDVVLVGDTRNDRVQQFNEDGEYIAQFGTKGSGAGQFTFGFPIGLAIDASGDVWVTDSNDNRIEKWVPGVESEGEAEPPQPGFTVEYHVPVSGVGAPYTLSKEEVEKWGQKDVGENEDNDPVEATAVFPPDAPQGWPASNYTRATIDYMNEKGRTVNTASPGGAIATSEYNAANETIRTLNADNRAAAMNEGCKSVSKKECKSAEVSELLDTKTEYNPEDTEIVKVLGPEHKVKLSTGPEVQARAISRDYYDEGAVGAEEENHEAYSLITKSTSGALLSDGEEKDVRTTTTGYSGQGNLGWKLRKPTSVTTDPGGLKLTHMTEYDPVTGNVTETRMPDASKGFLEPGIPTYLSSFGSKGPGHGEIEHPGDVAVGPGGNLWVLEDNTEVGRARVEEFNQKGEYLKEFGSLGSGNGQMRYPTSLAVDSKGDVWVLDDGNDRVEEFSEAGVYLQKFGSEGSGNGQFQGPEGIAVDSHDDVWVADSHNGRLQEFNEKGEFMKVVGSKGTGPGQFGEPEDIAIDAHGNLWIPDWQNSRVEEFSETGSYVREFGSEGTGNGQFRQPYGIAVNLSGVVFVADTRNDRVQEFNEDGEYVTQFGTKGSGAGQFTFGFPVGLAIDTSGDIWVTDSNDNRIEKWSQAGATGERVHESRTIYYSAAPNPTYPACGDRPEWANLACQTEPVAQPEDGINLPVKTFTYNIWDEVETTTEKYEKTTKFPATTRTITQVYDPAGRALTSEETASPATDTPLPKVTNEYNSETGALEKQSAVIGGKTKTTTSKDNTLGQLASYTDAEGKTSKYAYDIDGRTEEMSYEIGKEAFSQIYAYSSSTGFLTSLYDTGMKKYFTATYDAEGKMLTEVYPNGMTAKYAYNSTGAANNLEYVASKASGCTGEGCVWFKDAVTPSIHGETLIQVSSLSKESYVYDNAGRLTETQETPAGKDCKSRLYAYDEESNRTSETTRESATETCATEGGTTEKHSYDEANRLADGGVEYEVFGNTTKLPAADAETHELTSTYYVDGQVATQKQNEETLEYVYDPAGRAMETKSKGKTAATVISHYSGPGEALTWTGEEEEKKWSRNVPGIDGALDAIETSSGATTLQLHDLEGNIVGEAAVSETETKLLKSYNSTEFGVPSEGKAPPKYAWLGAGGVATEPSFGTGTVTQSGASYVPQLARNLQTAAIVPPGAFPDGPGTGSHAVSEIPGWYISLSNRQSEQTRAEYLPRQEALNQESKEKLLQQCREEGGCGAELAGEDPSINVMLSASVLKVLIPAISTGSGLAGIVGKLLGIKGTELTVFTEAIKVAGEDINTGLNYCLNTWRGIGESEKSKYRCRLTFNWFYLGGIPVPEHINIDDCYYDASADTKYDCANVYKYGFELGLS